MKGPGLNGPMGPAGPGPPGPGPTGQRGPSIFSSMSCLAWSICWGEPRMMNNLKLGSPLGGSCREISTKAPVCWFMAFTFSPPRPMTSPHLWVGMEKVISPPGGPQLPWPLPRPRPPGGMPGPPGGPGGPLLRLWRRSLMIRAACSHRSGGPIM